LDSPPLARGLRRAPLRLAQPVGLTPAGAGTSGRSPTLRASSRTHPRWRGDFAAMASTCALGMDSPPLARGLPPLRRDVVRDRGLTPAGAGTSSTPPPAIGTAWTHHRWRGDFVSRAASVAPDVDSPPLARGLRFEGGERRPRRGLTPAGAGTSLNAATPPAPMRTHPRWRGDFHPACCVQGDAVDSPPPARGLHRRERRRWRHEGLTPAGAGTSNRPCRRERCRRTHPRWRGDFASSRPGPTIVQDSPPLARGLLDQLHRPAALRGLTPAGAGTSFAEHPSGYAARTHPRWRGDFEGWIYTGTTAGDSPPLARGLRGLDLHRHDSRGLTPAGAGTSDGAAARVERPRTHPRWRGDFGEGLTWRLLQKDSPPLARGLRRGERTRRRLQGLTPAGAGTSCRAGGTSRSSRTHPRWRGDFPGKPSPGSPTSDSPPLARGLRAGLVFHSAPYGLTPAGAGTSSSTGRRSGRARTHPRWRGDFSGCRTRTTSPTDSPPLARGLPQEARPGQHVLGLTPAGAGTSCSCRRCRGSCRTHPRWRGDFS